MRFAPSLGFVFALVAGCAASTPPVPADGPHAAPAPGAPTASAPVTAVASAGPLTDPGPAAASCTQDAECGTYRCNVARGKCASPCATDADCAAGATCMKGVIPACLTKAIP